MAAVEAVDISGVDNVVGLPGSDTAAESTNAERRMVAADKRVNIAPPHPILPATAATTISPTTATCSPPSSPVHPPSHVMNLLGGSRGMPKAKEAGTDNST